MSPANLANAKLGMGTQAAALTAIILTRGIYVALMAVSISFALHYNVY